MWYTHQRSIWTWKIGWWIIRSGDTLFSDKAIFHGFRSQKTKNMLVHASSIQLYTSKSLYIYIYVQIELGLASASYLSYPLISTVVCIYIQYMYIYTVYVYIYIIYYIYIICPRLVKQSHPVFVPAGDGKSHGTRESGLCRMGIIITINGTQKSIIR